MYGCRQRKHVTVDIYKNQLNESREETKRLRRHSDPSCPQLQIIYPVNEPESAAQWQWRQETTKKGYPNKRCKQFHCTPKSVLWRRRGSGQKKHLIILVITKGCQKIVNYSRTFFKQVL
ncbi:hypothetical protein OS493_033961 [Desmophyllum pertusum]|uniref:Uncharacterized protein n=1 Tax=Desmophyllum pertusum TaxID=174260 RepID=A0A9X0D1U0_9CNID|nr:hypothetical protein OS493_033961 [Desmophyllum pertusum]